MRVRVQVVKSAVCISALVLAGCGVGGSVSPPPPPPPPPTPVLTSMDPVGEYAGHGGFPLVVNGSGFVASSTVQWNGSSRATTFVSSSQLSAQVLSSDLAAPRVVSVTVVNPSSGTSNPLTFTVSPGPAPGTGVIQLITVATDGTPGNGNTFTPPAISADGRYVAFQSDATNLVPGPASGFSDIYVRDTCLGAPAACTPTTTRVSVAFDGSLPNGNSRTPTISADGRYVDFDSSASNLVPNDTNGQIGQMTGLADVFLRDTCIGAPAGCTPTTTRVSLASDGSEANGDSRIAMISGSGRFVAFGSGATNLVPGDTNSFGDVFVRDTCVSGPSGCTPSTLRISVDSNNAQANMASGASAISPDGRFGTFLSYGTNLVAGDTNNQPDAFVRDTCSGAQTGCAPTTNRVSVGTTGTQGNDFTDNSGPSPISADGRYVAFTSFATNLVAGDTNDRGDVFVRDTCVNAPTGCTSSTTRVSVDNGGAEADNGSHEPSISGDGRFVVFSSLAFNLIPGGTGAPKHVFLRDTCAGAPTGCVPTTILLSMTPDPVHGNGMSDSSAISADGHYVVFRSTSTNLLPGVSDGRQHIYLARTGY